MPGVAQVWLTDEELRLLDLALPHHWLGAPSIHAKLAAARAGLTCPVSPARASTKVDL